MRNRDLPPIVESTCKPPMAAAIPGLWAKSAAMKSAGRGHRWPHMRKRFGDGGKQGPEPHRGRDRLLRRLPHGVRAAAGTP